jgi:hypothetical protein
MIEKKDVEITEKLQETSVVQSEKIKVENELKDKMMEIESLKVQISSYITKIETHV